MGDVLLTAYHTPGHTRGATGKGWFVYLRLYGPEVQAFDGSWNPGDFEEMK
jgi:hypothetical protein